MILTDTIIQCDGKRPECAGCIKEKTVCQYVTASSDETHHMAVKRQLESVQGQLQQHADILEHLCSVPDSEALDTIHRLRSTPNVSGVLSAIRNKGPRKRISSLNAARGTLPPMASNIEFESTVLHRLAYPVLDPIDIGTFVLDDFVGIDTLTCHSRSGSTLTDQYALESEAPLRIEPPFVETDTCPPHSKGPPKGKSPIPNTLDPQQYCDPRLNDLDLSYWTKVPISREFAASAISVYLENEHTFMGSFDPEIFLTDLVNYGLEYCSSFLVSAVLCVACVSSTFLLLAFSNYPSNPTLVSMTKRCLLACLSTRRQ